LSPVGAVKRTHKGLVGARLLCLILSIALLMAFVYWLLSLFWLRLETSFVSLPLASGIITGVLLTVFSLLAKLVSRRGFVALLLDYLGADWNAN